MAVLIVGTFRESDLSRDHPLTGALATLRRELGVERLELAGLEDVEIIDLLEGAAGHEMASDGVDLAHALRRETGGNPFFLVEVIRHLAETGEFAQDHDGRWVLTSDLDSLGLPTSVREVVAHRVARLGDATEQALSHAAVIGRDFDLDVLAGLVDTDEDRLVDLLEGAIGAGLVRESDDVAGRYRFVHAIIQHTLYQDLGATRRQRVHQRIAETLERVGREDSHLAELARHWIAATRPTDLTKAIYYARRAGDAALAAYAPMDAIAWYAQALELLGRQAAGDERERGALLVALGTAQRQAGQPEHRQTLRDAAEIAQALSDHDLLVAAALAGTTGSVATGEGDEERIRVLRAALDVVSGSDPASRALLLAGLVEVIDAHEWEFRRDLADEAVTIAASLPSEATALDVITSCYLPRARPELSAEHLAETAQAIAMADRVRDPGQRFLARHLRVYACMESGDLPEVDRRLGEMQTMVDQTGLPLHAWILELFRSCRLCLSGDLAAAEASNDAALEIGARIEAPEALANWGAQLFAMRRHQGRVEEVADMFTQAAVDNPAIPVLRAGVVGLHCTLGRLDEARKLFEPDAANGFVDFPRDLVWTSAMILCSDNAVDLDHRPAAQLLYDKLDRCAGMVAFNGGTVEGPISRALGRLAHLLGRHDESEALFRAALAMSDRLHAPYWTARTKLDYADLLTDRAQPDDSAKATELVEQALAAAEQYGFGALQQRATAALR